eukprot:TRINITY_DN7714_c0_g1_i1.p1 TRINITY_DN7714_c0_g1~~TRINITY_DN7714_c0_g1_i1.p1  ORF type:complete len:339 (-),score=56.65 TRINITY_DN7714_c0_g1_i1:118-1134(-)
MESLRHELKAELQLRDALEVDAQISLFVVAANSLRHHSALRPFPSKLFTSANASDEQCINHLRSLIQSLPSIKYLQEALAHDLESISDDVIRLLHWIFLDHPTGLRLSVVMDNEECDKILELAGTKSTSTPSPRPHYIFEISTYKSIRLEKQHRGQLEGGIFGYHGSKLTNIYSILSNGLQQHRNEVSLFGQGIYLSSDLQVVQYFSKSSTNWSESSLGAQVNCVLLCETFDHPDVKMSSTDPSRNYIQGSEGGRVPDKYIVVQSNDLIINKYLLLYSRGGSAKNMDSSPKRVRGLTEWISRHGLLLFFISYLIILFAIGFSKTNPLYKYLRRWDILK